MQALLKSFRLRIGNRQLGLKAMRLRICAAFGLISVLFSLSPARADWSETREGAWKAAYACDGREETCLAITCELGEVSRFGIWSTQFGAVDASRMRQEERFDIDIDGAASSLAVEGGEYLVDKRVIFWPLDRQLLAKIDDGTTLSIRGWGEPKIDLLGDDGLIARTVEGCSLAVRASVDRAQLDAGVAEGATLWNAARDPARRVAVLKDIMPKDAACERSGDDASCRVGEQANSILARFDSTNDEFMIRAEIAHGAGDHDAYRNRLYDTVAAFGIPQTFADRCLLQGLVTLDVAGYRVECDSYTPPNSTIATFYIRQP